MKKQDIDYLKKEFENDYLLCDFIATVKTNDHTLKVCYIDKVITITDSVGFAYLCVWWCEGSITGTQAEHLTTICRNYNERF